MTLFKVLVPCLVVSIFISYKLPRWFQITPYPWAVSLFAFPFVLLFTTVLVIYIVISVSKEPVNLNEMPVSYWADPKSLKEDSLGNADDCSLANAQAIVKAGLPFPNYTTKDELAADGKTINKRIVTVDVWLGGERFVFPAELVSRDSYPTHNPKLFQKLMGTLPHFYPSGPPAPYKDGMGPSVFVRFYCSMVHGHGYVGGFDSNEEAIKHAKAVYEQQLIKEPAYPGTVTIIVREDLGMTEVLLERVLERKKPDISQEVKSTEAKYLPLDRVLWDSGKVRVITCNPRNYPPPNAEKNYGLVSRCVVHITINPYVFAQVSIYVSHLDQMPSIFDQVQQVILNAKKAAE